MGRKIRVRISALQAGRQVLPASSILRSRASRLLVVNYKATQGSNSASASRWPSLLLMFANKAGTLVLQ
jgi:hypothetical protein